MRKDRNMKKNIFAVFLMSVLTACMSSPTRETVVQSTQTTTVISSQMEVVPTQTVLSTETNIPAIKLSTPTPTYSPEILSISFGEIPSQKEQEEIENVIEAYIDVHYRALSVSNGQDFKQNGFGNLISSSDEAERFRSEETSKMMLEIKRAEVQLLRYVEYEFSLNFRSIVIDSFAQTATVVVDETNKVVYEISAEINSENPIISQSSGIEHIIFLEKIQGEWKIISDTYNDDLWKILRKREASTDEMLEMLNSIPALTRLAPTVIP